jgi:2-desacetyl-2-hydroxyethyl bacteriochlorophyllide A dehydrogenase
LIKVEKEISWCKFLKAITLIAPKIFKEVDTSLPTLDSNEVLVKTKIVGICGSDLLTYGGSWIKGYYWGVIMKILARGRALLTTHEDPLGNRSWLEILGHEVSGTIEDWGKNVYDFKYGQRIALTPNISCHNCKACRTGYENLCIKDMEIGSSGIQGALAEYVKIPAENIVAIPPTLNHEAAAISDCVAVALHAVKLAEIKKDHKIVILGAGTMGLLILQVLNALGLRNIAITDLNDYNLDLAKRLGADYTFNASQDNICKELQKALGPINRIFECVGGKAPTLNQALNLVGFHGRTIAIGNFTTPKKINILRFRKKESILIGCSRYTKSEFREAVKMLIESKINTDLIITHKFPICRIREAFETALNRQKTKAIKVQLEFK